MQAVWFRNDLRITAHRPLQQALASGGPVQAVYCLCPGQWQEHQVAPLRQWYLLQSLLELGEALAERGVDLTVLDCGDFQALPTILERWATGQGISALYCNREYPLNERQRDRAVAARLQAAGIRQQGFDDSTLVPPRALRTGQGTPYTVFTPYKRRWDLYLAEQPPLPAGALNWPGGQGHFYGRELVEQALASLSLPTSLTELWPPGEQAAWQRLTDFIESDLAGYRRQRDFPALAGTSLLSTALSAGTLAPSSCYQLASQALLSPGMEEGAACWIGELAWRDFYRQIMANYPQLSRGLAFKPETECLPWRHDQQQFQAWCDGQTGYPLVDAAMRQLQETGWMHNRLRMLVAMFLTKHLFIDWRWGESYFMSQLIDGDFAANNGGWQWSASTGTDAVPYFRVFNPVRQSQRFDPKGTFIRRYLPELAGLDERQIHQPWKYLSANSDYPHPLVSLEGVRDRVSDAFKQAKAQYHNMQREQHETPL